MMGTPCFKVELQKNGKKKKVDSALKSGLKFVQYFSKMK